MPVHLIHFLYDFLFLVAPHSDTGTSLAYTTRHFSSPAQDCLCHSAPGYPHRLGSRKAPLTHRRNAAPGAQPGRRHVPGRSWSPSWVIAVMLPLWCARVMLSCGNCSPGEAVTSCDTALRWRPAEVLPTALAWAFFFSITHRLL
jgi:hypothetical protein